MSAQSAIHARALDYLLSKGGVLPSYAANTLAKLQAEEHLKFASGFADSAKQYPVIDKGYVFLSAVTATCAGASDKILGTLKKAAVHFGVDRDVSEAISLLELEPSDAGVKSASVQNEPVYALPEKFAYRVDIPARLAISAQTLVSNFHEHTPPEFVKAAGVIVQFAKKANVRLASLAPEVVSSGTPRLPRYDDLRGHMEKRAKVVTSHNKEAADTYLEIAEKSATFRDEDAPALVALIDEVDAVAGINLKEHRRHGLKLAAEIVFSGSTLEAVEKAASECVHLDGKVIPRAALADIPDAVLCEFRNADRDALVKIASADTSAAEARSLAACVSTEGARHAVRLAVTYGHRHDSV